MAHGIESNDVVGITTENSDGWTNSGFGWHRLGTPITEEWTARQACEELEMDYEVRGLPVHVELPDGTMRLVDDYVLNCRMDDLSELGMVSKNFQNFQNISLADMMDALAQTGQVKIQTAGTINGGKKVWFCASSEHFEVQPGDLIEPFFVMGMAHDGTQSIWGTPFGGRPVCQNTLPMISSDAAAPNEAAFSIRHSGDITKKLDYARQMIAEYKSRVERHKEDIGKLVDTPVDRDQSLRMFAAFYANRWPASVATETELTSTDPKVRRLAERRYERQAKAAEDFLARYDRERELLNLYRGNAWVTLNAMTGYMQHDKRPEGADTAQQAKSELFGTDRKAAANLLEDCLAIAS